jgi:hypothetical protein
MRTTKTLRTTRAMTKMPWRNSQALLKVVLDYARHDADADLALEANAWMELPRHIPTAAF